jgi:putative (di)nucleoside polyphosphate hydrolase
MRVARRDVTTSRLKAELLAIREFVSEGRPDLAAVLPYMTDKPAGLRTRPLTPSGGLVDLVGMVTAAFAGISLGALLGGRVDNVVTVLVAIVAASLAWLGLTLLVRRVYRSAGILGKGATARSETFRANVGIVLHDGRGQVMVFERNGRPGSWQFPQGGIEPGEGRRHALWRELREETGLTEADVSLERELGRWLTYELPDGLRSAKTGLGQTQWWFLGRVTGDGRIPACPDGELVRAEWVSWDRAIDAVVDFKRPVYAVLARELAPMKEDK